MTQMIEVKTAELVGPALDWAVGIVVHGKVYVFPDGGLCPPEGTISLKEDDGTLWTNIGGFHHGDQWRPSTDWTQGGLLIDQHQVWLSPPVDDVEPVGWDAEIYGEDGATSAIQDGCPTALIAVCRAVVQAKLGDVVSVPAELA
ncbi:phage protein NinX family protein [Pseudomonas protegens]|uniref:phage protein NinX family protein n=1 Tax=Pseudomonas protegens TaxID=380021 RepID=UPI001568112F|nr:phage protein NinX family protein [Pseudomonas protegens]